MTSGIYRLRLPVPNSNWKNFQEQRALLVDDEQPASVALLAATMLLHHQESQPDPLNDGWVRCKETAAGGSRVVLAWSGGRLSVNSPWDDGRYVFVWLASARRAS